MVALPEVKPRALSRPAVFRGRLSRARGRAGGVLGLLLLGGWGSGSSRAHSRALSARRSLCVPCGRLQPGDRRHPRSLSAHAAALLHPAAAAAVSGSVRLGGCGLPVAGSRHQDGGDGGQGPPGLTHPHPRLSPALSPALSRSRLRALSLARTRTLTRTTPPPGARPVPVPVQVRGLPPTTLAPGHCPAARGTAHPRFTRTTSIGLLRRAGWACSGSAAGLSAPCCCCVHWLHYCLLCTVCCALCTSGVCPLPLTSVSARTQCSTTLGVGRRCVIRRPDPARSPAVTGTRRVGLDALSLVVPPAPDTRRVSVRGSAAPLPARSRSGSGTGRRPAPP
jgi:hypothetical protein